jgi:hypothetical protein
MDMRRLLIGAILGGVGGAGVSYYLSQTTYKLMCQTCFCPEGDYACCNQPPGGNCNCPEGMPLCPEPKTCPNDQTELQCVGPALWSINPMLILPPVIGIFVGVLVGLASQKF